MRKIICRSCKRELFADDNFLLSLKARWELQDINEALWSFGTHINEYKCDRCGSIGKFELIGAWPSFRRAETRKAEATPRPISTKPQTKKEDAPRQQQFATQPITPKNKLVKPTIVIKQNTAEPIPHLPIIIPPSQPAPTCHSLNKVSLRKISHHKGEGKRERDSIDANNYLADTKTPGFIGAQKKWLRDNGMGND